MVEAGHTLMTAVYGLMVITESNPLPHYAWGFNADRVRQDAEAIGWKDMDFLASLIYGFKYYAPTTPHICTASPHQNAARMNSETFFAAVDK